MAGIGGQYESSTVLQRVASHTNLAIQRRNSGRKKETFWYCSENCSFPGPWRVGLTRCISCGHDRCRLCPFEEVHIIRDTYPLPSPGEYVPADSERKIPVKQAEARAYREAVAAVDAQSSVGSTEDLAAESDPSLVGSIESEIRSDGEISFIQGDAGIEGYSLVDYERIGTLSTAVARLMLKSFLVDISGKSRTKTGTEEGSSSKHEGHNSQASSTSSTSPVTIRPSRKRSPRLQDDREDPEDHEEDGRAKRPCRLDANEGPGGRLLACPYYRFDSNRYSQRNISELSYRGCSSVVIRGISRLKQHLYRVHRRPEYYCGSCYCVLEDQNQLDAHAKQRPPCNIAETPKFQEQMNRDQMNSIKRRSVRKEAQPEWLKIYKILFPNAASPPSLYAYADNDSNEIVQAALRQFEAEGPTLLSTLVQDYMHDHATLDDHTDTILEQALELAGSRLISLLRARLDGLQPPSGNSERASRTESHSPEATVEAPTGTGAELPELGDILDLDDLDFDLQQWLNTDSLG